MSSKLFIGLVMFNRLYQSSHLLGETASHHPQTVSTDFTFMIAISQVQSLLENGFHRARKTNCSSGSILQQPFAPREQVPQTQLMNRLPEAVIRPKSVADQYTPIVFPDNGAQHLMATALGNCITSDQGTYRYVQPTVLSGYTPPRLVRNIPGGGAGNGSYLRICRRTTISTAQYTANRSRSGNLNPKQTGKDFGAFTMRKTHLLVQNTQGAMGIRSQLGSSGPQGIRSLQLVPTLNPATTILAIANVNVKTTSDWLSGNFRLVLRQYRFLPKMASTTMGANRRQRNVIMFVNLFVCKGLTVRVLTMLIAWFATWSLGILFLLLTEWGRLAFAGTTGFFQSNDKLLDRLSHFRRLNFLFSQLSFKFNNPLL
jgi:hypothetical protein